MKKKAHYDYTLCTNDDCKWKNSCQRNLIHYEEQLVYQSIAHFVCDEKVPQDFLKIKPEGEYWE